MQSLGTGAQGRLLGAREGRSRPAVVPRRRMRVSAAVEAAPDVSGPVACAMGWAPRGLGRR